MNKRKLFEKVLASSNNVQFREMITLVEAFGFQLSRIKGSHHIFTHPEIPELLNLQERNGKAKQYQVRQFLQLVEQYNLDLGE